MNNLILVVLEKAKKEGLSVRDLADAWGIPESRIYNWKNGRGNPKIEDFEKITDWMRRTYGPTQTADDILNTVSLAPTIEVEDDAEAETLEIQSLLDALFAHYCQHVAPLLHKSALDVQREIMRKAMQSLRKRGV